MKRILVLLILMNLCQGVFSLEVSFIKEIDVLTPSYRSNRALYFCDDAKKIAFDDRIIDVQDGTINVLDDGEQYFGSLNRFGYIYEKDKFDREQTTLVSFEHGKKPITGEVFENLKGYYGIQINSSSDLWVMDLYGNTGIRIGEFRGRGYGIEFFLDTDRTIDLPIEMQYDIVFQGYPEESLDEVSVEVSYDLFTGVFSEDRYYQGTGLPDWTRKLHIFNLIYDGSLTSKTEIKETPSHEGKILGYLNEGESVKVSKAENYEKREGYQDYWYYVTTDSYSGWCTGEFLLIEGDSWYNRFELRGPYVEWDEIPESEDMTKIPIYGLITSDTNLYELPVKPSRDGWDRWKKIEDLVLENYFTNESVQNGSVVEVIDKDYYTQASGGGNTWYKIRLENGTEGWVLDDDIDVDLDGTQNLKMPEIMDEIIETERVNFESPERHGVMNDTQVRLRSNPSLDGAILEHLNTGDEVTIIGKTIEKYQVGDMEDHWYKVTAEGYPSGWVYGAFVDFIVEEIAVIEDSEDALDITVTIDEENTNTAIPWVIGCVVLLLGAIATVIIVKKKKS